jgi:hypothetical protein
MLSLDQEEKMTKEYIGDGVYVDFDGFQLRLTTEDGYNATNTIYLEPNVYEHLVAYVERLKEKK